jgi:hypothetical protein
VDASPIQDQDGNPIAVTDISIQQADQPGNYVEQQYDPNDPEEQFLTLGTGLSDEQYYVGVTWADGSQYLAQWPEPPGGTTIPVTGPNQDPDQQ